MKLNYEGHLIITRTLQKGGMNDFIFLCYSNATTTVEC